MGAPIANARKVASLLRILERGFRYGIAVGLIINFLVVKVNWYILLTNFFVVKANWYIRLINRKLVLRTEICDIKMKYWLTSCD